MIFRKCSHLSILRSALNLSVLHCAHGTWGKAGPELPNPAGNPSVGNSQQPIRALPYVQGQEAALQHSCLVSSTQQGEVLVIPACTSQWHLFPQAQLPTHLPTMMCSWCCTSAWTLVAMLDASCSVVLWKVLMSCRSWFSSGSRTSCSRTFLFFK